ncbi:MAG: class I SAM-dependent methyltransferase [Bacteroidota bacterium]
MWLPLKLLDNASTCPICGHKSRAMLKVGHDVEVLQANEVIGAGVRYVKCIWCSSTDRDRLVYLYLKEHCAVYKQDNLKILHIAPERCLSKVLRKRTPNGYVPADINTGKYWYINGMTKVDITRMHYDDSSFDIILCNHVLEHIPDDKTAISELYRVLRPAGIAILQVPIAAGKASTIEKSTALSPTEQLQLYGQKDHVRLYGQDYTERLKMTGGKVHIISLADRYPGCGLHPKEQLFVLEKL